jgi:hypothetical protein
MEVRIKYSNYRPKEFKSLGDKRLNECITLFKNYPWITETSKIENIKGEKTYPTFKIINENGETILISGFKKNEIILYHITLKYRHFLIWRTIDGLRYDYQTVLNFIETFYQNNSKKIVEKIEYDGFVKSSLIFDLLSQNLTNKDILVEYDENIPRYISYRFSYLKTLNKLYFALLLQLMPLGLYYYIDYKNQTTDINFFIIMQIVLLIFVMPVFYVFMNHFKHSKDFELIFKKNDNRFVIKNGVNKKVYDKNEVVRIEKVISSAGEKMPWSDFYYWNLIINDNAINISSTVIDELSIISQFELKPRQKKKLIPLMN